MPRLKEAIQWTVETAGTEFAINPRTLKSRFAQLAIEPAYTGGKYSTAQITLAVFGDIDAEKLRKAKADADKAEIDAAKAVGEVILKSEANFIWADATIETRKAIESAVFIDSKQKAALLAILAGIKLPE